MSGPAVWSLQPSRFAFDVVPANGTGLGRLRVVLDTRDPGTLRDDVFEVTDEAPGRSLDLRLASSPHPGELAIRLSVAPGKADTTVGVSVRHQVDRASAGTCRSGWRELLNAWLLRCAAVLEGREPPVNDEDLPDGVRAAFMRRRPVRELEDAVSAVASMLIAAPFERTWQVLHDPATTLRIDPRCVAAGRVPCTPAMRAGGVTCFLYRDEDSGRIRPEFNSVDYADSECATAQEHITVASGDYLEVRYQGELDAEQTRVTLTAWAHFPKLDLAQRRHITGILESKLKGQLIAAITQCKELAEG